MNIIDVLTGELAFARTGNILISHAIGSCVVVSTYDPLKKLGAMAHIMLPGKAPDARKEFRLRYTENALDDMFEYFIKNKTKKAELVICLTGGANVLKRKNEMIHNEILRSVIGNILDRGLSISAQATGGTLRRTAKLIVNTGEFIYSEGNSNDILLYRYQK